MVEKLDLLKNKIETHVLDLLYYDRRFDEELSQQDVDELFRSGKINTEKLTEWFAEEIKLIVKENYQSKAKQ